MGAFSPWHIVLVLVLAVLLFGGGGKISSIMGDFAKGIKAFRKGLSDDDKQLDDKTARVKDASPDREKTHDA